MTTQSRKETFTTSKGFKFTRTERGWLDETTGLEWDIEYKIDINQYDAEKWAKEQRKWLPSQDEFIEAEKHGIRELPEMLWEDLCFWSSSAYPGYSDSAYVFNGHDGYTGGYGSRDGSDYVAARCLSPAGGASRGVKVDSKAERLKKAKDFDMNKDQRKEALELAKEVKKFYPPELNVHINQVAQALIEAERECEKLRADLALAKEALEVSASANGIASTFLAFHGTPSIQLKNCVELMEKQEELALQTLAKLDANESEK